MVVVNLHTEARSSGFEEVLLEIQKKYNYFLLLALDSGHFMNLFFSEECVEVIDSGVEFSSRFARGECRYLFAKKKKGSALNRLKTYRAEFPDRSFDFPSLHPENIVSDFKVVHGGCSMETPYKIKTKINIKKLKSLLGARITGGRSFEPIKTLQLGSTTCWHSALNVLLSGCNRGHNFNYEAAAAAWSFDHLDIKKFF